METLGLTTEMMIVLTILALTVFLFVSEIVRVDVAAILVMVLLGCLASLPGMDGLVDVSTLFSGFGSNAVISIIAVMIIGAGLDRTGVMSSVAVWITRVGGSTESRIVALIASVVGVISSFMQQHPFSSRKLVDDCRHLGRHSRGRVAHGVGCRRWRTQHSTRWAHQDPLPPSRRMEGDAGAA